MAVEALALNAHKNFKWRLEINGCPAAMIQKITGGEISLGMAKHGGAGQNFPVKEAGQLEYAPFTLETIVPLAGPGTKFFLDWLYKGQDPRTGDGGMPKDVKKDISLYDLMPNGTALRVFTIHGAQASSDSLFERDAEAKDKNTIDKIKLEYDWMEQVQ